MGTFTIIEGAASVYEWNRFDKFSVNIVSDKKIVLNYDAGSHGPHDPLKTPYKIVINTKNVVYETDDDGNQIATAGTVSKLTYKDDSGNNIATFTGLSVDLSLVTAWMIMGQMDKVNDYLFNGGHEFIGSDNNVLQPGQSYNESDVFQTGTGNDTVTAMDSYDFIQDAGGADHYDGGDGNDTVSYESWFWNPGFVTQGIVADLNAGTVIGPDGFTDTLVSIERIRGTFLKDVIKGNNDDNRLSGLNGADILNGKGGFDMVRYDKDANQGGKSGVIVDLAAGTARDGFKQYDTLLNIEAARGTDKSDLFKDDGNDNYFEGRGGDDKFVFTGGNDEAYGGGGADTFVYKGGSFGDNFIRDFEDGSDLIEIRNATGIGDLTITEDAGGSLITFGASTVYVDNTFGMDASDFIF
ncbi:MAG: calcium-binding protein [Rhodobacteraceae bacterium]|nr:calcium-binding protein [Paracoccaceae bacterium]